MSGRYCQRSSRSQDVDQQRAGRRRRPSRAVRRGIAVIMVLGLLSITLALSYSMLRTQVNCVQIQSNSVRHASAQLAAMAGIQTALQAMSGDRWAGVDVPVEGRLSDTETYYVTYRTGDASLDPSHPDFAEYPYRVTLFATGRAEDPASPEQVSVHRVRVVVQLVRRKLADPARGWSRVVPYTAYQWSKRDVDYELPVRIEGPCYLQGRLRLCRHYPNGDARSRYLEDLQRMHAAGAADLRPFQGPVFLPFSRNPERGLLANELNVSIHDVPAEDERPFDHPGRITGYRLYPGGQQYEPQVLGWSLKDTKLGPDPVTNPLGIFVRRGTVRLQDNVAIHGMLATWGGGHCPDVYIDGRDIALEGIQIPPLAGDDREYQLPAVAAEDDIYVFNHASGAIEGLVVAGDDFEVVYHHTDVQFHVRGKLVCGELEMQPDRNWDRVAWNSALNDFESQGSVDYFPQWIERQVGLAPKPVVTVKPDASGVVYHWPDWTQPLFVAHPDDGGLRWAVIDWKDGPELDNEKGRTL